jgi:hypothetical protein
VSYEDEINQLFVQQRQLNAVQTAQANASAATARNVTSLMEDFPWLVNSPGLALSLAQSGQIGGGAAKIADAELRRQVKNNPKMFDREVRRRVLGAQKRNEDTGFWGDLFAGVKGFVEMESPIPFVNDLNAKATQPAIRYSFAGLQYPLDILNASLRSAANYIANPEFTTAFSAEDRKAFGAEVELMGEQSPLVQNVFRGKSMGEGYLPNIESEAFKAAGRAAREASPYLIGGHAWTPGRAFAGELFDPDTTAFTVFSGAVDAAIAWRADPANIYLSMAGRARQASKTLGAVPEAAALQRALEAGEITRTQFDEAAGILGRRPMFDPVNGLAFLNSDRAVPLVQRLAAETSPTRIRWGFNGKLPADLAVELAEAADESQVRIVLARAFGTEIERIPQWRNGTQLNRWLIDVPEREIDPNNLDATLRNLEGFMVTGKVNGDRIADVLDWYIDAARSNNPGEIYEATTRAFLAVRETLVSNFNVPENLAAEFTRIFDEERRLAGLYWADSATGGNRATRFMMPDGSEATLDGPMLMIERFSGRATLPSSRELRALANDLEFVRRFKTNPVTRGMGEVGDMVNSGLFKPLMLLRAAWTVRVVGEEMLRIAVGGTGGFFQNPMTAFMAVLGDQYTSGATNRLGNFIGNLSGDAAMRQEVLSYYRNLEYDLAQRGLSMTDEERAAYELVASEATGLQRWQNFKARYGVAANDVLRDPFARDDEAGLGAALSDTFAGLTERPYNQIPTGDFEPLQTRVLGVDPDGNTVVQNVNRNAGRALVQEIDRFSRDADVRRALEMSPDEYRAWGRTAEGRERRAALSQGRNAEDPLRVLGTSDSVFDQYVDTLYTRIEDFSQGNQTILQAMRYGNHQIGNRFARLTRQTQGAYGEPTRDAVRWAEDILNDPNAAVPEFIKTQRTAGFSAAGRRISAADSVTRFLFDMLGARPTNLLNRSPEYRLNYWREIERLLPAVNPEDTWDLARALDDVRLPPGQKERLRELLDARRQAARPENPDDVFSLEEIDRIAKRRSLNHVRDLLYDLSKRNQFADSVRVLFPFAEAWKEVLTTWVRLVQENPQTVRRFQQIMTGARDAEVDPITGLPTNEGVGIIHYDKRTQQEVFVFPGAGWLLDKIGIDTPFPLLGSVRGLNMIGTGLPSVGPVVQMPVNAFLPDKPKYDTVSEFVFPFGRPENKLNPVDYFTPAWGKRVLQIMNGPQSDRTYMNRVIDVMRYKASTGEYSISGPDAVDEINRLIADSREDAKWLTWVNVLGSFTLPSAPIFTPVVEDVDGNLQMAQALIDDYRKMRKQARKEGRSNADAFDEFIQKWGTKNVLSTQSKTDPQIPGLTSTKEQRDWERNNPDLVERYPNVWALFAPEGKTRDQTAYAAQVRAGQLEPLSDAESVRQANDRMASHLYQRQREFLESQNLKTSVRAQMLRDFKQELLRTFPGYTETPYARDNAALIVQLEQALSEPVLANSVTGEALIQYFQLRATAQEIVRNAGLAWPPNADRLAPVRDAMVRGGELLRQEYPQFERMWTQVLQYEFDVE